MNKGPENLSNELIRQEMVGEAYRYVVNGVDWREVRREADKPTVDQSSPASGPTERQPDGMITVGGMEVPIFKGEAIVGSQGVIFDGKKRIAK